MNKRRLIHVVLIAAVWLSQLAATLHLVGHLDSHEHNHQHASIECEQAEFHTLEHYSAHNFVSDDSACDHQYAGHIEHAPTKSEIGKECSQYHVYLGMYACITAPPSQLQTPLQTTELLRYQIAQAVTAPTERQRIRGPPSVS